MYFLFSATHYSSDHILFLNSIKNNKFRKIMIFLLIFPYLSFFVSSQELCLEIIIQHRQVYFSFLIAFPDFDLGENTKKTVLLYFKNFFKYILSHLKGEEKLVSKLGSSFFHFVISF